MYEWIIHVFVLHWRPRRVGRLTVDSVLARKHRLHHADPRDVPLVFIPWQALLWIVPSTVAISVFAFGRLGLGLTFLVSISTAGLGYEWTHFLIHSDYRPKTALYRAVWNNHRMHHFKNEHYWFTVTSSGTADRLFGTLPRADVGAEVEDRAQPARAVRHGRPAGRRRPARAGGDGGRLLAGVDRPDRRGRRRDAHRSTARCSRTSLPPFAATCTVHEFGEGVAPPLSGIPDDPLCVEYAKRDITVTDGGAVRFLAAEPARVSRRGAEVPVLAAGPLERPARARESCR